MSAKHTPGPWKIGHMGDGERFWIGQDWDRKIVAHVDRDDEANARLIAAAPEMRDALIMARALIDQERAVIHGSYRNVKTGKIDTAEGLALIAPFDSTLRVIDRLFAKIEGEA